MTYVGPIASSLDFFKYVVEPTVAEFFEHPLDVRLGRLAAIVLYHQTDHHALIDCIEQNRKNMQNNIEAMRSTIISACDEFTIIRDVADATKHAQLSTASGTPRKISSYSQVDVTSGLFQAPFGHGCFVEACEIFVTLDTGYITPLLPAVRAVLNYWMSVISDYPSGSLAKKP